MGIRTTASDPVHFIYDSVSGYAIGPSWSDEDEMVDFLSWWIERSDVDLRYLSNPAVEEARKLFMEHRAVQTTVLEEPSSKLFSQANRIQDELEEQSESQEMHYP